MVEHTGLSSEDRLISTALDPASFDLIRRLAASPQLTQRQLASSLGMSLGKVNYCLRSLIEKGLVKVENYRSSENKLAYFYLLTPAGVAAKAELTRRFLERKVVEYEALREEIRQLRDDAAELGAVKGNAAAAEWAVVPDAALPPRPRAEDA